MPELSSALKCGVVVFGMVLGACASSPPDADPLRPISAGSTQAPASAPERQRVTCRYSADEVDYVLHVTDSMYEMGSTAGDHQEARDADALSGVLADYRRMEPNRRKLLMLAEAEDRGRIDVGRRAAEEAGYTDISVCDEILYPDDESLSTIAEDDYEPLGDDTGSGYGRGAGGLR